MYRKLIAVRGYMRADSSVKAILGKHRQGRHSKPKLNSINQRTIMSRLVLSITFAVLSIAAVGATDDPFMGTWKLDVAKSKYNPGPSPKGQIIKLEPNGDGVKSTTELVDTNGNRSTGTYTAYYDGRDYPFPGMADFDSTALKRIDSHTAEFVNKRAGKIVRTGTRQVSNDGKVMTITSKGTDSKGRSFNNVAVYEKQED